MKTRFNKKYPSTFVLMLLFTVGYLNAFCGTGSGDKSEVKSLEIYVAGFVSANDLDAENAEVKLYKRNTVITTVQCDENGEFFLELPADDYCTLEIVYPGYVSKIVSINTNILTTKKRLPIFEFTIDLLSEKEVEGLTDKGFLDFPAALIVYDADKKRLKHSTKYANQVKLEYDEKLQTVKNSR